MEDRARILIVDDDELVCRVLERILSRDYDVDVVNRAEEALSLLTDGNRYDVILSDFQMPRVDGARLLELITQLDRAQADRVIFVTANGLGAIVQTANVHTIIDKPFSPKKLRELVDRVSAANKQGYFPSYNGEEVA